MRRFLLLLTTIAISLASQNLHAQLNQTQESYPLNELDLSNLPPEVAPPTTTPPPVNQDGLIELDIDRILNETPDGFVQSPGQFGATSFQLMAAEAQRFANDPNRKIYVEYNGLKYPLKGWVKVQQRNPTNGTRIFNALGESERIRVQSQLQSLKSSVAPALSAARDLDQTIQNANRQIQSAQVGLQGLQIQGANSAQIQSATSNINQLQTTVTQATQQRIQLLRQVEQEFPGFQTRIQQLETLQSKGTPAFVAMRVDAMDVSNQLGLATQSATNLQSAESTFLQSDTSMVTKGLTQFKRPKWTLPAPNDANDIFYSPQLNPQSTRLGLARQANTALLANVVNLKDVTTNLRITPSFGAFYDTRTLAGAASNSFDVTKISLVRLPSDGQTTFVGSQTPTNLDVLAPTSLIFDTQVTNAMQSITAAENQLQFFVEANNYAEFDDIELRHIYGRLWNKGTLSVLAGQTQSLFSINGLAPASLSPATSLIGTSELGTRNPAQIRLQRNFATEGRSFGWGLAVEDPRIGDFTSGPATQLTRWPTFAGNLVFVGSNRIDRLQISSIIRNFGVQETVGNTEIFETGWGLAAFASKSLRNDQCKRSVMFLGAAGGEGIGQYIQGISLAGQFDANAVNLIEGFGAYAGYRSSQIFRNKWVLDSNFAYGYSNLNPIANLAAATNEHLHQAWANVYVRPSEQVAVGFEWQYGNRLTIGDGNGENSRFFFGVELSTKKPANTQNLIVDSGLQTTAQSEFGIQNANAMSQGQAITSDLQLFNQRESRGSFAHLQGL